MKNKIKYILLVSLLLAPKAYVNGQEDAYVGDETNGPVTSEDVKVPKPQISSFLKNSDTSSVQSPLIFPPTYIKVKKGDTFVVHVGVGGLCTIEFPDRVNGYSVTNNNNAFQLSYNKTKESSAVANQFIITALIPNQQMSVLVNTDKYTYSIIAVSNSVNSTSPPNMRVFIQDDKGTMGVKNQFFGDSSSSVNTTGTSKDNMNTNDINNDATSEALKHILTDKLNPIGADLQDYLINVESISANDLDVARRLGIYNDNYLIVGGDAEFRKNFAIFDDNKFTYLKFTDDPYWVNRGSEVKAILVEDSNTSRTATFQVVRNYIQIKEVANILKIVLDSNLPDNAPPKVICIIRNNNNRYKLIKPYQDNQ